MFSRESEVTSKDSYTVRLETNYPFENQLSYHIEARNDFELQIRIPSFAEKLTVDGKPVDTCKRLRFPIEAGTNRMTHIGFDTPIHLIDRPHNLKAVRRGSLVFALPIEYETVKHEYIAGNVERKFPYCDYEYVGKADWNYGICDLKFEAVFNGISEIPFSSQKPPIAVRALLQRIPWGLEPYYTAVCAKIPQSTLPIGPREEKLLIPYGCAKLRMTELPLV